MLGFNQRELILLSEVGHDGSIKRIEKTKEICKMIQKTGKYKKAVKKDLREVYFQDWMISEKEENGWRYVFRNAAVVLCYATVKQRRKKLFSNLHLQKIKGLLKSRHKLLVHTCLSLSSFIRNL